MPATETAISWTDATWNPIHGCAATSEGCLNCYAADLSYEVHGHTPKPWTADNLHENLKVQDHHLDFPATLEGPQRVFVNSMSDLFLPEEHVSDEYLHAILDVVEEHSQHIFLALTKHGAETGGIHDDEPRLLAWDRKHERWPENLWMGVSVESDRRTYRIDALRETGAATKWVSFEPLVERVVDPDLTGIDWVVIGGESGPADDRREMDHAWAREIRDAAREADRRIPVWFKQSSGPRQGHEPVLAEDGATPSEARDLDASVSTIRELPELPAAIWAARPDLAELEVGMRV